MQEQKRRSLLFPGFNCEVQGVFQEWMDGRTELHTYEVQL